MPVRPGVALFEKSFLKDRRWRILLVGSMKRPSHCGTLIGLKKKRCVYVCMCVCALVHVFVHVYVPVCVCVCVCA